MSSLRPFPFALAGALDDVAGSSSVPIEEEAEEVVREAPDRGRILRICRVVGCCEGAVEGSTRFGREEVEADGPADVTGEEAIEGVEEGEGTAIEEGTIGVGTSGAGAYVANLAGGLSNSGSTLMLFAVERN